MTDQPNTDRAEVLRKLSDFELGQQREVYRDFARLAHDSHDVEAKARFYAEVQAIKAEWARRVAEREAIWASLEWLREQNDNLGSFLRALKKGEEDTLPDGYRRYRRTAIAEMMEWREGLDMDGVSVSEADRKAGSPKPGDMIARNPENHDDRWLVAKAYFETNFASMDAPKGEEASEGPEPCGYCGGVDGHRGVSPVEFEECSTRALRPCPRSEEDTL